MDRHTDSITIACRAVSTICCAIRTRDCAIPCKLSQIVQGNLTPNLFGALLSLEITIHPAYFNHVKENRSKIIELYFSMGISQAKYWGEHVTLISEVDVYDVLYAFRVDLAAWLQHTPYTNKQY